MQSFTTASLKKNKKGKALFSFKHIWWHLKWVQNVNYSYVDYIFVFIVLFFTLRGFFRGFWSITYKLISLILSILLATKFYFPLSVWLASQKRLTTPILNFLSKTLNFLLPGKFSSIEQIAQKVEQDCLPIFKNLFEKLLKNISFQGEMSASQVLGQSLTNLLIKTISFVCVFLIILLIFKIVKKTTKNCLKNRNLNIRNKFFGAILGFFEGLIFFALISTILINFGESLLNQTVLQFAKSGTLSYPIADILNKKIISFLF